MTKRILGEGLQRRTIVKGAAWAVPVVAAAVAVPLASASEPSGTNGSWNQGNASSSALPVLGTGKTKRPETPLALPSSFTILNAEGVKSRDLVQVTIVVGRPEPNLAPPGRAFGFGPDKIGTVDVGKNVNSTYELDSQQNPYGFPATSITAQVPVTVGVDGSIVIPISWGLAGNASNATAGRKVVFPVTTTVRFADGTEIQFSTTITVPAENGFLFKA